MVNVNVGYDYWESINCKSVSTKKKLQLGLVEAGRSDLNSGFEGIHQAEGGDVGPAVLELLQVGQVKVEVGDEVVVVGGHHAHSL